MRATFRPLTFPKPLVKAGLWEAPAKNGSKHTFSKVRFPRSLRPASGTPSFHQINLAYPGLEMVRTGWEFTDLASRYPKMATSKGILGVSSIKFVEYHILGPAFLSTKWCGSGMVGESRDFWTSHVGGAALLRKLFDFHPCCPYNVNPKITNPQNRIKPLHLESWSYQVLSKPAQNSIVIGLPAST